MENDSLYSRISVYQDSMGYILIYDSAYPESWHPNHVFNLHLGKLELSKRENQQTTLTKIDGMNKIKACEIYLHWKWTKRTAYVIRQAWKYFPINCKNVPDETIIDQAIAHDLASQAEDLENSRKEEIKQIIQKQKISFLCHFTHVDNLAGILNFGLLNRSNVTKHKELKGARLNDSKRLDNHPEAICLSISFPNYQMFYKYNQLNQNEWVVICLRANILWKMECAFCVSNAASGNERKKGINDRKSAEALEQLFQDIGAVKRKELNIPLWFTTNPQAEVLAFGNIPVNDILSVNFYDTNSQNMWMRNHKSNFSELFKVNKEFFSSRVDYKFWQNTTKNNINGIQEEFSF